MTAQVVQRVCVKEMTGAISMWIASRWTLVTGKTKSCWDFLAEPSNPLSWSPMATESFPHACVTKPPKTLRAQRLESFGTAATWGFLEDGGKAQKLSAPPRPLRMQLELLKQTNNLCACPSPLSPSRKSTEPCHTRNWLGRSLVRKAVLVSI